MSKPSRLSFEAAAHARFVRNPFAAPTEERELQAAQLSDMQSRGELDLLVSYLALVVGAYIAVI